MAEKLRELRFAAAQGATQAWLAMRVGPGDEPLPPPEDLIVPGDGAMSIQAMTGGTEAGLAAFEACYREAFDYAPGLWGRIALRFHVTERGEIDEVFEAGSRFPDKRVVLCVQRAARKLAFEPPKGGDLRFVVPLRFSSERAELPAP
jgi:hypothetical protein